MLSLRGPEHERLSLAHSVDVDPFTGQMSLTVPLRLTAGRDGFGPNLSLVCSGRARAPSFFGRGWSLGGIDSIVRETYRQALPDYDDDTRASYRLASGVRLVRAAPDESWERRGYHVTRFRACFDQARRRFEQWCDLATGRSHWVVREPSGAVSVFGRAADDSTRIVDPSDPRRVYRWLLEATYEPKGSAIAYVYAAEDLDGVDASAMAELGRTRTTSGAQRYPKRVLYANDRPLRLGDTHDDVRWLMEVLFDYGEHGPLDAPAYAPTGPWTLRPDPSSVRSAGFDVRTYRLCRRVMMVHHMPELGRATIVGQTELDHHEDPAGTVVRALRYRGFDEGGLSLTTPALRLTYSATRSTSAFTEAPATAQLNMPGGLNGPHEWVDLDGEGIAGLLYRGPYGWTFKNNLGDGEFGPPKTVDALPNALGLPSQSLDDFDRDGHIDLVSLLGQRAGYYRRDRHTGAWEPFRPLPSQAHVDPASARISWADINGDGYRDLLVERADRLTWYPSTGPDGFSAPVELARAHAPDDAPSYRPDGRLDTLFADMTGDGLPDIVRVRRGRVEYWPNLGLGRFGPPVAMDDAPDLASATFDIERVRLLDVDGTGCASLLVLGAGEIQIWPNACGNRFGTARLLTGLPRIARPESLQVLDFYADGTLSLVWSADDAVMAGRALNVLRLQDEVPGLLTQIDDDTGRRTTLRYRSSAHDYLRDQKAGAPWHCKSPQHPLVVAELRELDQAGGSETRHVRWSYRDGCYDDHDRRFVGFAQVDTHDGVALTKVWSHTGCLQVGGTHAAPPPDPFGHDVSPPTIVSPDPIGNDDFFAAYRALAGSPQLRQVFALVDDEPTAEPLSTVRHGYRVLVAQASTPDRPAALDAQTDLVVTAVYEGRRDPPRVTRERVLDRDAYGCALRATDDTVTTTRTWKHLDEPDRYELGAPLSERTEDTAGAILRWRAWDYRDDHGVTLLQRTRDAICAEADTVALWDGRVDDTMLADDAYGRRHDGHWWAEGPEHHYADRAAFYRHIAERSPSGGVRTFTFDPHHFFVVAEDDAMGNRVRAEPDYRTMAAWRVTDANDNVTEASYDALGYPIALSTYGEQARADGVVVRVGDLPLADARFARRPSVADVLADPADAVGTVSRLFAHDLHAFERGEGPGHVLEIGRETRVDDGEGTRTIAARVTVALDYRDAFGRSIQRKVRGDTQWHSSGLTVFDTRGRISRTYDAHFTDDERFDAEASVSARAVVLKTEHDAADRIIRVHYPDGTHERHDYDAWATHHWNRNDTAPASPFHATPTSFEHDARLRPVRTIERDVAGGTDRVTTNRYDALGRLVSVTDARGLVAFTYRYDMLGRVVHEQSADAGPRWTLWDARALAVHVWTANAVRFTSRFDTNDRLTERRALTADGARVVLLNRYLDRGSSPPEGALRNAFGRLSVCTDDAGTLAIEAYDLSGEMLRGERRLRELDAEAHRSEHAFDALGRRVRHRAPDGTTRHFTYDALGHVSRVVVSSDDGQLVDVPFVSAATYDARGQRTRLVLGNGATRHDDYDTHARLSRSRLSSAGRTWLDLHYEHDAEGNVTRVSDPLQEPHGSHGIVQGATTSAVRTYRYDAFDQLVEATGRSHQALVATDVRGDEGALLKGTRHLSLDNGDALERYVRTYRYDLAGNLVRMRHGGITREWAQTFEVDPHSNRRGPVGTTTAFDAAGNRSALDHLRALEWDDENRLRRAVIIARHGLPDDDERYDYGADHQRVRRVTQRLIDAESGALERIETLYLDGCELRRVQRIRGEARRTTLERVTSHIMLGDQRIALVHRWVRDDEQRETDTVDVARTHYAIGDHLGSTALELDERCQLISYEEYFPFGGSSFIAGRSRREIRLKEHRYSGKLCDDTTGLYYFGYRYYAPWIGGWLSPDPMGPIDGLNLYRFVRNNPIRFVDPDGLEARDPQLHHLAPPPVAGVVPFSEAEGRARKQWIESRDLHIGDKIWTFKEGRIELSGSGESRTWIYHPNFRASTYRPYTPETKTSPEDDVGQGPAPAKKEPAPKGSEEKKERPATPSDKPPETGKTEVKEAQELAEKPTKLGEERDEPPKDLTDKDYVKGPDRPGETATIWNAWSEYGTSTGDHTSEDGTFVIGGGQWGGTGAGNNDNPTGYRFGREDGHESGKEWGTKPYEEPSWLESVFGTIGDFFQGLLDLVGMIPLFGEVADLERRHLALARQRR